MVDVKQIHELLNSYFKIKGTYKIDPLSGIVNVKGDVKLTKNIHKLPVQFGKVTGDFNCSEKKLATLVGAPDYVDGDFSCPLNNLTSLLGGPQKVNGHFYCSYNNLTSLLGAPDHVGGHFSCSRNPLTSLSGAPAHVGKSFYCYKNKLTSLAGAPSHVGGNFDCNNNPLISLSGAPDHVGGQFLITYAPDLPLLRLCMYLQVKIWGYPDVVQSIISKHAGTGRSGALKAAAELIRAGYAENARW